MSQQQSTNSAPIGEVDLKTNLTALPRRLSVRKQSQRPSIDEINNNSNNNNGAGDDNTTHAAPKRTPSVRFAQSAAAVAAAAPGDNVNAVAPPAATPKRSALRGSGGNSAENSPQPAAGGADGSGSSRKPTAATAAAAAATSLAEQQQEREHSSSSGFEEEEHNYGNLFAFEFLAASRAAKNAPWAWGIGREILSSVVVKPQQQEEDNNNAATAPPPPYKPHKRVIRLELWEVEAREDKLNKDERSQLALLRRNIAAATTDLRKLDAARRALEDSVETTALSIAAIESALAVDFADVHDLLSSARRALSQCKTEHFAEMRNYSKPPVTVRQVLECVLIALGDAAKEGVTNPSWESVKTAVRREDFVLRIRDFEPSQLSPSSIATLARRMEDKSFTLERATQASQAAGPLFQWVAAQLECAHEAKRSKAYFDMSKQIAAHKQRQKQLAEELAKTEPRLKKAQSDLAANEVQVDRLLFGNGHIEFAANAHHGGGGGSNSVSVSRTGALLSSPFAGLTFVPMQSSRRTMEMLRCACHAIGPPDRLEPSPSAVLDEQRVLVIRGAFDLPKAKPLVPHYASGIVPGAATTRTASNNNNNRNPQQRAGGNKPNQANQQQRGKPSGPTTPRGGGANNNRNSNNNNDDTASSTTSSSALPPVPGIRGSPRGNNAAGTGGGGGGGGSALAAAMNAGGSPGSNQTSAPPALPISSPRGGATTTPRQQALQHLNNNARSPAAILAAGGVGSPPVAAMQHLLSPSARRAELPPVGAASPSGGTAVASPRGVRRELAPIRT